MNPSQSEHCIRNVRLHVRFRQVEHIARSKHMDQNVPVPQRWRNLYQQHEEHTQQKKKSSTAGRPQRTDGLERVRRELFSSPLGGG